MANIQISEELFFKLLVDYEERYQAGQLNADQLDIHSALSDKYKRIVTHNTFMERKRES